MILRQSIAVVVVALLSVAGAAAQVVPRPFPQPGQPNKPAPPPPQPPSTPARASNPADPNEATLGVPVYPTAQFITSYDAGRGQRFFIFGSGATYLEIVNFYRSVLKNKGSELFEAPPTHQFEIGRFREETMAFPPSVTIKDYTWGGSAGYPNPRRSGQPQRFATVIQIVPVSPGTPQN